ncbi:MAG: hypothetical protein WCJ55_13105 [Chloroflexales bacterium]
MGWFERWSADHLGQAHYLLGYLIVLVLHNWPLFLAIGLCVLWGVRLYHRPTQARVCWFFGALLFGIAYEYAKHIAPTMSDSLDTVLGLELLWLNRPAHIVLDPVMKLLIFAAIAFFFGRALWLDYNELQRSDVGISVKQPGG